ncbi:Acyl-CoA-binding domain-containing protein 5 [Mortierella sp. AM989]|nr:Acyl-CoA-binding domain-containing protein 5 [Mortierella sp. AM989]
MVHDALHRGNNACHYSTSTFSSLLKASRNLVLIFFLLEFLVSFVSAESPISVTKMAYATVDETTFYVQMGILPGGAMSTNQFFSLDLTQPSWSSASPPWKNLGSISTKRQGPSDFGPSMTVSADKQNLIVWGGLFSEISVYDITSGSWSESFESPANSSPLKEGLKAVTDPSSGLVYIPSGANHGKDMMEYNPTAGTSRTLPMPSEFAGYGLAYYGAVWSTQRNSILLYGGHLIKANGSANAQLFEFKPETASWSLINTTGQSPGSVEDHCVVSAHGGTKIIVFGGQTSSSTTLSSIYILDIPSLSWTKGADVDPSLSRSNMACTVAGDSFVAWGGDQFGDISESLGTPIIYNLQDSQWTTQFSLSGSGNTSSEYSNKSNPGAIFGAVIGTMAVVGIFGYFLVRRNRGGKAYQKDIESSSTLNVDYYPEKPQFTNTDTKEYPASNIKISIDVKTNSVPTEVELPPRAYVPPRKYNRIKDSKPIDAEVDKRNSKRSSSRRTSPILSGDLEYLAQLSQLENRSPSPERKVGNAASENNGHTSPPRRASYIRRSRTPSVLTFSSQRTLQQQNAYPETEDQGLLKK